MDSESDFMDFSDSSEENSLLDYNYIFVDLQGFKTYRNRFICKEFCLIDNEYTFHTLIKSPYIFNKIPAHYKRQAYWLTNFHHGLLYESGDCNIIEVIEKLYTRFQNRKVAVKGSEKIKWLQYMFRNCCEIECVNFDDLDYDHSLERLKSQKICKFHADNLIQPVCALRNVLLMQDISNNNRIKYI